MDGLRYVYFGDTSGTHYHNGVVAVGYWFNPETKKMQYAVAFCSPNDRFNRKKAHAIIKGRMKAGVFIETAEKFDIPPKYADTIADIINKFNESTASAKNEIDNMKAEVVNKIKEWVLSGQEFTIGDIFYYLDQQDNELVSIISPTFCNVNVPLWALEDLVIGR